MIESIRHKGLRLLYDADDHWLVGAELADKFRLILSALDAAGRIEDMNQAAFGLHPLRGDRAGEWAVKVNKNWRVTFRFAEGKVTDVDYEDYH
jgi:toxin HigB-1